LPVTFYKSTNDLPPFEDYSMEGRSYKYFKDEALYEFGFGLSYSKFEYSEVDVKTEGEKINLTVNIKNFGEYSGDEVVQVYAYKTDPQFWRPIKQLIGFERISLMEGEEILISIEVDKKQLQYWDVDHQQYKIEPGLYEFQVGSSSRDIKLKTTIDIN